MPPTNKRKTMTANGVTKPPNEKTTKEPHDQENIDPGKQVSETGKKLPTTIKIPSKYGKFKGDESSEDDEVSTEGDEEDSESDDKTDSSDETDGMSKECIKKRKENPFYDNRPRRMSPILNNKTIGLTSPGVQRELTAMKADDEVSKYVTNFNKNWEERYKLDAMHLTKMMTQLRGLDPGMKTANGWKMKVLELLECMNDKDGMHKMANVPAPGKSPVPTYLIHQLKLLWTARGIHSFFQAKVKSQTEQIFHLEENEKLLRQQLQVAQKETNDARERLKVAKEKQTTSANTEIQEELEDLKAQHEEIKEQLRLAVQAGSGKRNTEDGKKKKKKKKNNALKREYVIYRPESYNEKLRLIVADSVQNEIWREVKFIRDAKREKGIMETIIDDIKNILPGTFPGVITEYTFLQTYTHLLKDLMNGERNDLRNNMKKLLQRFFDKHGNVPSMDRIMALYKFNDLEADIKANEETNDLFITWFQEVPRLAAGRCFQDEKFQLEHLYTDGEQVPKGKEGDLVESYTKESEALALVMYEGWCDAWRNQFEFKAKNPKDKIPMTEQKFKGTYSSAQSGQKVFGKLNQKGMKRFKQLKTYVKEFRDDDEKDNKAFQKLVRAAIQDHKKTLDGTSEITNKRKRGGHDVIDMMDTSSDEDDDEGSNCNDDDSFQNYKKVKKEKRDNSTATTN